MKRLLLNIIIWLVFSAGVHAIPAYPHKVKIAVKNGYVYVTIKGDESYHYGITDDGHTVVSDSLGWFYLCKNEKGEVLKSKYRLEASHDQDSETKLFLEKTPKGLCPEYIGNPKVRKANQRNASITQKVQSQVVGQRKVLIVLMQFADLKFKKSPSDFDNLFNKEGYNDDGAFGSVRDYYKKVSYNQLDLQCDVYGPYTMLHNMSYYGGNVGRARNDRNPYAMFEEMLDKVSKTVNLADYDSNGDGYVDNIHIIYAGHGEEAGGSPNAIWAHEMSFSPISVSGVKIDRYSCSPELRGNMGNGITRIGAPCHEIGHALGANDYYDVDYQNGGYYEGTGDWDIMASGSWNDGGARPADFNPYVKYHDFGWIQPVELDADSIISVIPSEAGGTVFKLNTPVPNDYFLLENRNSSGVTGAEPSQGLLVFHIGPNIEKKSTTNTINATYPQECYLVDASSKYKRPVAQPVSYGDISSAGCPFPGAKNKTKFSKNTIPAACSISGKNACFSLASIVLDNNGTIGFDFHINAEDTEEPDYPTEGEDTISVEGNIIWNDDFESFVETQTWWEEQIEGTSFWENVISTDVSDKKPEPVSGHGYMVLTPKTGAIGGDVSTIKAKLVSPVIALTDKSENHRIHGYYRIYDTRKITTGRLCVYVRESELADWIACPLPANSERNVWKPFAVDIMDYSTIQFAMEGEIRSDALLFVDNIKITSNDIADSQIVQRAERKATVYTLDGVCIGKDCDLQSIKLNKGIYILQEGGMFRKIIIN